MDAIWLQKLADWGWTLIFVVFGFVYRLGSRVTILEENSNERTRQITALASKLDNNTAQLDTKTAQIQESIEGLRKEFRDDHRMVVTELLKKVPQA
jgi:mannose-6-phosphate isomerase class I